METRLRAPLSCLQLIICSLFILLFYSSRKNIERFLCQIQMVKPVRMYRYFTKPTGFFWEKLLGAGAHGLLPTESIVFTSCCRVSFRCPRDLPRVLLIG